MVIRLLYMMDCFAENKNTFSGYTGEGDECITVPLPFSCIFAALSEEQSFLLRCNRRNRMPATCFRVHRMARSCTSPCWHERFLAAAGSSLQIVTGQVTRLLIALMQAL